MRRLFVTAVLLLSLFASVLLWRRSSLPQAPPSDSAQVAQLLAQIDAQLSQLSVLQTQATARRERLWATLNDSAADSSYAAQVRRLVANPASARALDDDALLDALVQVWTLKRREALLFTAAGAPPLPTRH
jgi:hypothetical protein